MRIRGTTRRLAETVVAVLSRPNPGATHSSLSTFTTRDWERAYFWLDASGVALYFLDALKEQQLESSIPIEVLRRIEKNQADNRSRTSGMFNEFVEINETFRRNGVRYVTLKGFSLVPDYCQDLSLRYQMDLDFLISPSDKSKYRELLERKGYRLKGMGGYVWEFQAGEDQPPTLDKLYKPRSERAVELHLAYAPFSPDDTDEVISRSEMSFQNGFGFPTLSPRDMFLSQSFHLLGHIRSEWTRLSWLLEFKYFVSGRHDDRSFWSDIRRDTERLDAASGIGTVTLLATELFGEFAPRDLTKWSVDTLPPAVRAWISRYGREAMLAEFPGTKLYLLLDQALAADTASRRKARRVKLLPTRLPRKIADSTKNSRSTSVWGMWIQMRYVLFRLWFHIAEGVGYGLETRRWRKVLPLAEEVKPGASNEDGCALVAGGASK